ncbi:MAG: hypothetical protein ABGW84_03735 [Sphingomonadaceae bacterium]
MRGGSAVAALATLTLAACTMGPDYKNMPGYGQGSGERIDGSRLGGYANPSEVAATDIAFSRAARDDGQWTAFRRFAADGAVIHGRNGVIDADPWLAAQDDPPAPVQWTPTAVWSSCDGSVAVTQGKFAEPEGQWGYYVTVWERQRDGRYRWVYDMGAPDDQLTAAENARRDSTPTGENAIVIRAIEAIEGRVADCPRSGESLPQVASVLPPKGQGGAGSSRDDTLRWSWDHAADGTRGLTVLFITEDGPDRVARLVVAPDGKHVPDQ